MKLLKLPSFFCREKNKLNYDEADLEKQTRCLKKIFILARIGRSNQTYRDVLQCEETQRRKSQSHTYRPPSLPQWTDGGFNQRKFGI